MFRPDRDEYIGVDDDLLNYSAIKAWTLRSGIFGETYKALN